MLSFGLSFLYPYVWCLCQFLPGPLVFTVVYRRFLCYVTVAQAMDL